MATITVRATYPVAPALVWEELRHIDRHVHWMSDALAIDFTSDQREGVGTTFRCTTKVGPLVTHDLMSITRWDEGSEMGVDHVGLVKGAGVFTLGGTSTTTLTWRETITFPWWGLGRLGALAASPVLRALWAKNLRRLGARLALG